MGKIEMTTSVINNYLKRRGRKAFALTILLNELDNWLKGVNVSRSKQSAILLCCRIIGGYEAEKEFITQVVLGSMQDMRLKGRKGYLVSEPHFFLGICEEFAKCNKESSRAQREKLLVCIYQNYAIWLHDLTEGRMFISEPKMERASLINMELDKISIMCDRIVTEDVTLNLVGEVMFNYLLICNRELGKTGKSLIAFEL